MADLTELQAAQTVKIASANASGVEQEFIKSDGFQNLQVTNIPQDSPYIDSMNRQRVSDQTIIGSYCFFATAHDLLFNSTTATGGTIAFNAATSSTRLSTTTTSGSSAIRQTKRYFRYSAGLSHSIHISGNMGAKKTNVRQRWGQFDANDGLFFEQTGTDLAVVIRTSASGSAVDTRIVQSSWNTDKLDGTGASGVTLDTSKHNLFFIDYTWHGAGRVRFGVFFNGLTIYCHEFNGANVSATPFMKTPRLPIRVELTNTGTAATATNLDLVCTAFIQEAVSAFTPNYSFSKSSGRTSISANATTRPIVSIRPKLTLNGITNRVTIEPTSFQGLCNQQAVLIQLILNPTLTGATFTSVDANSAVEADIVASALTGGTVIAELYVPSSGQVSASLRDFTDVLLIGLDIAGTTQDILTVAAQSTAGGSDTWCAIGWQEYQ